MLSSLGEEVAHAFVPRRRQPDAHAARSSWPRSSADPRPRAAASTSSCPRPVSGHTSRTEGAAHAQAQRRLDEALERRSATSGIEVTGEVGDEKPMLAVGDVLRREEYDEIILSTLPPGVSKWLKRDLPHKLATQYHLPVTHIVGTRSSSRSAGPLGPVRPAGPRGRVPSIDRRLHAPTPGGTP